MTFELTDATGQRGRLRLQLQGTVQGVGFRPFVYRIARQLRLGGWVANTLAGAEIEVEGPKVHLEEFVERLLTELPPLATVHRVERVELAPLGDAEFMIRHSEIEGEPLALVLPDVATCEQCLREIFDPTDRRYQYPFTNCTNCGPRYSIILRLPYDRQHTTMASFQMCPQCQAEYEDPANRRFHAQPNACPVCGPQLLLLNATGTLVAERHDALVRAVEALREGAIVALKGIGGFQLLVDARSEQAVQRLRRRKKREEKPFAMMVPSLEQVRTLCRVNNLEERLLVAPEAPIVLLERRADSQLVAPSVAPGNPYLGVMLPYSPLHHLLMREFGAPLVATSGNLTDEPICISTAEALERLAGIADFFLTHNRPIARYVDDSVVRVMMGRPVVLRRARGYAPLPVATLNIPSDGVLAFGAHLKNTVVVGVGNHLIASQHIGDLETEPAVNSHRLTAAALVDLYRVEPRYLACDLHPDYVSTTTAMQWPSPSKPLLVRVPHHIAHVLGVMAEHNILGEEVLGVGWDGTGLGLDHTIWGSEFFLVKDKEFRRLAHFRPLRALGGDGAMREPRRAGLAILAEIFGASAAADWFSTRLPHAFAHAELPLFLQMINTGLNSPWTAGAGRLFDAVASLLDLRQKCSFEGQAAMELEWSARPLQGATPYPLAWCERHVPSKEALWSLDPESCRFPTTVSIDVFNWEPAVRTILEDRESGVEVSTVATRFHATLVEVIITVARRSNVKTVVLSGGCFQNRLLTEHTCARLEQEGFRVFIHEKVPPNDGGIAVGQAVAAAFYAAEGKQPCV